MRLLKQHVRCCAPRPLPNDVPAFTLPFSSILAQHSLSLLPHFLFSTLFSNLASGGEKKRVEASRQTGMGVSLLPKVTILVGLMVGQLYVVV